MIGGSSPVDWEMHPVYCLQLAAVPAASVILVLALLRTSLFLSRTRREAVRSSLPRTLTVFVLSYEAFNL